MTDIELITKILAHLYDAGNKGVYLRDFLQMEKSQQERVKTTLLGYNHVVKSELLVAGKEGLKFQQKG